MPANAEWRIRCYGFHVVAMFVLFVCLHVGKAALMFLGDFQNGIGALVAFGNSDGFIFISVLTQLPAVSNMATWSTSSQVNLAS